MFTSFNSLPVYTAHSLEEQGALRELLDTHGIKYSVSLRDINAPEGFYPALSPELLQTQTIEYIFLVHKKEIPSVLDLLKAHWTEWEEEPHAD